MKGNPKKQKKLKIVFKQAEGVSEEEAQQRLNRAFDILFNETIKQRKT